MSDPETPESGEPTEGGERTRESEIKANVEFWKDLGVEVDEADVRAKIEELPKVEGFDFYLYIPKGIKGSELWQMITDKFPSSEAWGEPDRIDEPRSNQEDSYVIAARYQQEPDRNSLGDNAKSAQDWEKSDEEFLSPRERMIAELRWYSEQRTLLDEKNATLCPGSRRDRRSSSVVYLRSNSEHNGVRLRDASYTDQRRRGFGIRRIITKDTKV